MRWYFAAALGILGCAASGADRETRHFLAVSATSYNPTTGAPPGEILLYDRATVRPFAQFDFAGPAFARAVTPDGAGVYVEVSGAQPGIAVIEPASGKLRSFLDVPGFHGLTIADDRVLGLTSSGVVAIDAAAARILANVPCPGPPQRLVYNDVNGAAYATMIGRQDLCMVTPDLEAGAPVPTPLAEHEIIDAMVLLDNNWLLVTAYAGGVGPYKTFAVDVGSGRSAPVPSLDAVYPSCVAPGDPNILYGQSDAGLRAYRITFAPDGAPVFTPDAVVAPRAAYFADDRYLYAGVPGSCSTPEGPVTCSVGFRMLDPSTLAEVASVAPAQQTSFGLFGARSIGVTLSAPLRLFGSSALPPRRSQK